MERLGCCHALANHRQSFILIKGRCCAAFTQLNGLWEAFNVVGGFYSNSVDNVVEGRIRIQNNGEYMLNLIKALIYRWLIQA